MSSSPLPRVPEPSRTCIQFFPMMLGRNFTTLPRTTTWRSFSVPFDAQISAIVFASLPSALSTFTSPTSFIGEGGGHEEDDELFHADDGAATTPRDRREPLTRGCVVRHTAPVPQRRAPRASPAPRSGRGGRRWPSRRSQR